MRERMICDSYLTVKEVAAHFGVTRSTVDQMPREVLPYIDLSVGHSRQLKRFHPVDVLATPARLREWTDAKQRNEGDEYLEHLRAELEERDGDIQRLARETWKVAA